MTKLTRFTFLLTILAACGATKTGPQVGDACDFDNDCGPGLFCDLDGFCSAGPPPAPECETAADCTDDDPCTEGACTDGTCSFTDVCEATATAELDADRNANGSLFAQTLYSDDPNFITELSDTIAADEDLVVGECVNLPAPTGGTAVTGQSMGAVSISKGGSVILTLTEEPNGSSEAFTGPDAVAFGDTLDAAIAGSAVVGAGAFSGALKIPAANPSITDPTSGGILGKTIQYAPLAVDFMKIRFSFIGQNNQIVTIVCRLDPATGTITLPQSVFDQLPQSGTIFIDAFNRTRNLLDAADGVARSIVSTFHVGGSQSYTK